MISELGEAHINCAHGRIMRPHILQGLNPKPRRCLRRNKGRINSLTEWIQPDRIAEAEGGYEKQEFMLFIKKLLTTKPVSFFMLNGVLCCLSLSFIDAFFCGGNAG